ncbi:MAG: MipA/OmpV family protein, partial [Betaproteobacteria bacterium]|nr:MipA/OmpV family protein [Betaproteobacteria bacterium]
MGLAMSTKSLAADQSTAAPLWEIGGFALAVSQQAYPGADQQ